MPSIPHINWYSRNNLPIWNVTGILQSLWGVMFVVWCRVFDIFQFMAMFLWMKDNKILRGHARVTHHLKTLAHVKIDLEDTAIIRKAIDEVFICVSILSYCIVFGLVFWNILGNNSIWSIIKISLLWIQLMIVVIRMVSAVFSRYFDHLYGKLSLIWGYYSHVISIYL